MNPTLDGFVWTTAHDSRAPVGDGTIPQFMDTDGFARWVTTTAEI